ncbi:D-xylose ABC transporter ATP-binding protein [Alsobacter soli]|uniref:D-xylose ABC transporter ATP-binding protein n=1 Tax=Alsobacter soli TaxID=2109933 RepID=A0A2T1HTQ0_9HYPH|nr:sugar ABC transporter ATP-binding protein [Alsobacter soli]PSC04909.1 D-xylose ABC transporter ATP-binding protein [Alsobacter soli]
MAAGPPFLEARNIGKRFPGVVALDQVSISVERGQIHALIGENGAGKSTLMKILDGIYKPDEGEILLDGKAVVVASPFIALGLGISMVHQEPKLCDPLSISENVFMGRLPRTSWGRVDWAKANAQCEKLLARVGLRLDPRMPVEALSIAQRQLIQLAKALAFDARLIILDEPTASLTPVEVDRLFAIVQALQAEGVSFLYISHHLDEIFRIASRVTVLKDGRKVSTISVAETNKDALIGLMVGRDLGERFPEKGRAPGRPVLEAQDISGKGFRDASLTLRAGEIVGLSGLVGAGRTELARALFGADPIARGRILIDGHVVSLRSPADAIRRGVAYIAEDRRDGLFMPLSVRENIALAAPEKHSRLGVLEPRKQAQQARSFIGRLNVRTPHSEQRIALLSGGNQQKCILARWLLKGVRVLILDEPTRGIDVGAKREIYALVDQLAREGMAVLLISSELPEILGMADRVLVMSGGRITGEVEGQRATEERLLALALPTESPKQELHA